VSAVGDDCGRRFLVRFDTTRRKFTVKWIDSFWVSVVGDSFIITKETWPQFSQENDAR
jgi:hypothetical protein